LTAHGEIARRITQARAARRKRAPRFNPTFKGNGEMVRYIAKTLAPGSVPAKFGL
jgi:hypothetical protein